jgi:hypothetical protein
LKTGRISQTPSPERDCPRITSWQAKGTDEEGIIGIAELQLRDEDRTSLGERVLPALDSLPDDGALVVLSTFDSSAVTGLAAEYGYRSEGGGHAPGRWSLLIRHAKATDVLDLRELEAPEPLERILLETAKLGPGDVLMARTPRLPKMLLPQLERRGLEWAGYEEPDASGLVWIRKPA